MNENYPVKLIAINDKADIAIFAFINQVFLSQDFISLNALSALSAEQ